MAVTPEQMVDTINARMGKHPHHRALHAKGTVVRGTFTATPDAAELTRAAQFSGTPTPVTARVSNGNGNPNLPDYHQDVRGLAVAFHLDGSRPVISAQSLPLFSVRSPDEFQALIIALAPGPSQVWRLPAFLISHPHAATSLPTNGKALKPPRSYATLPYYAIHAYKWIAHDGSERFVRYHWMPEAGDQRISGKEAKAGGRDYLRNEIGERLAAGPARFTLRVQVAEDGDVTRDPSSRWPASRRVFDGGTLELSEVVPEEGVLVFDPTAVTDGIELSDDVVLQFRAGAYTESINRRV